MKSEDQTVGAIHLTMILPGWVIAWVFGVGRFSLRTAEQPRLVASSSPLIQRAQRGRLNVAQNSHR